MHQKGTLKQDEKKNRHGKEEQIILIASSEGKTG